MSHSDRLDPAFRATPAGYPPGFRYDDLDRRATRLDDLSPPQLWRCLSENQQFSLLADFFRSSSQELAELMSEREGTALGDAILRHWREFRDQSVERMHRDGRITPSASGGGRR